MQSHTKTKSGKNKQITINQKPPLLFSFVNLNEDVISVIMSYLSVNEALNFRLTETKLHHWSKKHLKEYVDLSYVIDHLSQINEISTEGFHGLELRIVLASKKEMLLRCSYNQLNKISHEKHLSLTASSLPPEKGVDAVNAQAQAQAEQDVALPSGEVISKKITVADAEYYLTPSGKVFVQGANSYGRLGLGHNRHVNMPEQIKALENEIIKEAVVGSGYAIFITDKGVAYTCGHNNFGQLGLGLSQESIQIPTKLASFADEEIITAKSYDGRSYFFTKTGKLYVCGKNNLGQLGLGHTNVVSSPVKIPVIHAGIKQVMPGMKYTVILTKNDEIYVWSHIMSPEKGLHLTVNPQRHTPIKVSIFNKELSLVMNKLNIAEKGKQNPIWHKRWKQYIENLQRGMSDFDIAVKMLNPNEFMASKMSIFDKAKQAHILEYNAFVKDIKDINPSDKKDINPSDKLVRLLAYIYQNFTAQIAEKGKLYITLSIIEAAAFKNYNIEEKINNNLSLQT